MYPEFSAMCDISQDKLDNNHNDNKVQPISDNTSNEIEFKILLACTALCGMCGVDFKSFFKQDCQKINSNLSLLHTKKQTEIYIYD